jgi:hypothetical protein
MGHALSAEESGTFGGTKKLIADLSSNSFCEEKGNQVLYTR